ncbi:hypothetical protein FRB90_011112 [Tulasnella sp. 427]|nr:hypothetical protein FRB90_011112 [Tulasnella sp. 427]
MADPTTSRDPSSPVPPSTAATGDSHAFAFLPPGTHDHRQQTSSSTSTDPPVATPPRGLPLRELAAFNGYTPSWGPHPPATMASLISNFAFRPPTSSHVQTYSPQPGTPSNDSPPTAIPANRPDASATRESHSPLRYLASSDGAGQMAEAPVQVVPGANLQMQGCAPARSHSTPNDGVSIKSEYDIDTYRDKDTEDGRKCNIGLDACPPPTLTSEASHSEYSPSDNEDSPYPEVRACVSNADDHDMPCLTFRVWVLGILFCASISAVNIFFYFRNLGPWLTFILIEFLAYPCGLALAKVLPIRIWTLPRSLPLVGGWEFSLNPSPWNIKEHAMVLIMAYPATNPDYGLSAVAVIEKWYHIEVSLGFTLALLLSTQLAGLGIAGLFRRILIRPAPYNVVVNQVFGTVTGLGMSFLTFDWNQISWIGSPLVYPFWSQLNMMAGFVSFYWILSPALYYLNVWKTGHLPISGVAAYDQFAQPYDISRVITSDHRFNVTAYEEYSPLYLPVTYAMTYLLAFTLSTGFIVHATLCYGPEILRRLKGKDDRTEDIHARLMKRYAEAPSWYYGSIVAACTVLMLVAVKVEDIGLPVWAPLLATLITVVYSIPMGYMLALTGLPSSVVNLVAQASAGSLFPGSAVANIVFKTLVAQTAFIMVNSSSSLKIAHYIKCGHKPVFWVQIAGGLIGLFTQLLVKELLFRNIGDICDPDQPMGLTCPVSSTMYTASIVWGLIGPARQFGKGSVYSVLPYAALVGAIVPIPLWLWIKRHPASKLRYIHIPLVIAGPMLIPPAGGINYSSWFVIGLISRKQ